MKNFWSEVGGTIIIVRWNLSLWKNDANRVKERKERSWNVSAMRVDGRHATMHSGRGEAVGGGDGGVWGVPIPRAVLSFGSMHGRCRKWRHAIPRSIPRLKHDLTVYFRRTTPCIKSFLQSGTQWASLPFGSTILPANWPGSFVSNSIRVGIFLMVHNCWNKKMVDKTMSEVLSFMVYITVRNILILVWEATVLEIVLYGMFSWN